MSLSRRSVETLIDLVEIKLACLEVSDREDARERRALEACRRELAALGPGGNGCAAEAVVAWPQRAAG